MASMIPDSHRYLLGDDPPVIALLATVMPDGSPQLTPVWLDTEGDLLRVNTTRGRVKERNMLREPRVAITLVDPEDAFRHIQLRGEVAEITEDGAREHIEHLSQRYTGGPFRFMPPEEIRVIFKIRPTSVTVH